MKITVTKKDIENGFPASCSSCPIALAIRRATRKNILVGSSEIGHPAIGFKDIKLPKKVRLFIERFDQDIPVKPFSFTLDTLPWRKRR